MQTVLLVEDDFDNRDNAVEILQMAGYHVSCASNGKEGVDLALEIRPDLIICDIIMPVLDGFGVLYLLQRHELLSHTPFIFLTGKTERESMRKGMEMGADDYITKPYEATELLRAVEARLGKFSMLKKHLLTGISGLDGLIASHAGGEELERLKENRKSFFLYKKQLVYCEGSVPSNLFYIRKGKIKCYKTDSLGKEIIVGLLGEGDFLGYVAMFEGGVYRESAQVMDNSELIMISRWEFDILVGSNPEILKRFIKILVRDIDDKERHLLSVAYDSVRKKVAEALVVLYEKYNKGMDAGFVIDLSRDNLAAIAGVARESLIRTLFDFRDDNIIYIDGCGIKVLNYSRLHGMIN